jgi:hypothetical protein
VARRNGANHACCSVAQLDAHDQFPITVAKSVREIQIFGQ